MYCQVGKSWTSGLAVTNSVRTWFVRGRKSAIAPVEHWQDLVMNSCSRNPFSLVPEPFIRLVIVASSFCRTEKASCDGTLPCNGNATSYAYEGVGVPSNST